MGDDHDSFVPSECNCFENATFRIVRQAHVTSAGLGGSGAFLGRQRRLVHARVSCGSAYPGARRRSVQPLTVKAPRKIQTYFDKHLKLFFTLLILLFLNVSSFYRPCTSRSPVIVHIQVPTGVIVSSFRAKCAAGARGEALRQAGDRSVWTANIVSGICGARRGAYLMPDVMSRWSVRECRAVMPLPPAGPITLHAVRPHRPGPAGRGRGRGAAGRGVQTPSLRDGRCCCCRWKRERFVA